MNYFKANILTSLFILPLLAFPYYKFYYSKKFYLVNIYQKFIEKKEGIIFQTIEYISLSNVKTMTAVKYPFSNIGNLKFEVGGDTLDLYSTKQDKKLTSNGLKISYLDNVYSLVDYFDSILIGKNISDNKQKEISESLINSLPILIIISIFIFTIPFVILQILLIKNNKYFIYDDRLINTDGIIYKRKRTVLFSKINSRDKSQGLLNKIFGNGNISVFTKGSSLKDLYLKNIKGFEEIYNILKSKTK